MDIKLDTEKGIGEVIEPITQFMLRSLDFAIISPRAVRRCRLHRTS
jgi:hypothetical protein